MANIDCTYYIHSLRKLPENQIMPGTNCYTTGGNTSQKHTRICIFKIPKAKAEIQEHKNEKKNIRSASIFFLS